MNTTKTIFQCHRREFIQGVKAGEWEKAGSTIEYGDNATTSMLTDGSGYYINDPDNERQYFVDMKQINSINTGAETKPRPATTRI